MAILENSLKKQAEAWGSKIDPATGVMCDKFQKNVLILITVSFNRTKRER